MHRTQLLLEPWQVEALRARADRAGISLSELVRRVLSDYLAPEPEAASDTSPLFAMEGIGQDPTSGRDHDALLYEPPARSARRAPREP